MIKCAWCGEKIKMEFDPDRGLVLTHPNGPMQCSGREWVIRVDEVS
jgi:sarcosine oxidase delta subunit